MGVDLFRFRIVFQTTEPMNNARKTLAGILALFIMLGAVAFPAQRAQAIFGLGDIVFDPSALMQMIEDALKELARWAAEDAFKALRDRVVKQIVDDMTNDIIAGIEGKGDPSMILDWKRYLKRGGDAAFSSFNDYLTVHGLDLCAPFAPQLRLSFGAKFSADSRTFHGVPMTCRFEDFKDNLQNTKSFIASGGWKAFDEMFYPENNFYGMSLLLTDAYTQDALERQNAANREAEAGGGFLSVKQCTHWTVPSADLSAGGTMTFSNEENVRTYARSIFPTLQPFTKAIYDNSAETYADSLVENNCDAQEVKTPGMVVGEAATKAVLKDFEYSSNVQSIIAALVNTLIGKAFDAGKGLFYKYANQNGGVSYGGGKDYSTGEGEDYTKNIRMQTKAQLDVFKATYSDLGRHFEGLVNLAKQGTVFAKAAVGMCAMGGKIGAPSWGVLVYGNSKEAASRKYANLGDLIDYPPVAIINGGEVRLPTSSDPNYYPDGKDGYFTDLLGKVGAEDNDRIDEKGHKILNGAGILRQGRLDAENNIVDIDKYIADLANTDNPEVISSILNGATDAYTKYSRKYEQYASEILNRDLLSSGEPGQLGGAFANNTFSAMLQSVIDGLQRPDYPSGIQPDKGHYNFFFCESRS